VKYTYADVSRIVDTYSNGAYEYRRRRHEDWDLNYALYRDKIPYNRLTQRQSVNIPLLRYIIKSALKEIDDPVDVYFKEKGNDKQKEIYLNMIWADVVREQKINIKDIVDKKQNFLTGRSTSGWNVENGKVVYEIDDTFDIFFDQYTDPTDVDNTCQFMEQRHIFVPLSSLDSNMYSKKGITRLKEFYESEMGVVVSSFNNQSLREKNERMQNLGFSEVNNPELGETIIELRTSWVKLYSEKLDKTCIYQVVNSPIPYEDSSVLSFERQDKVIGSTSDDYWQDHFIKTTWADDVERNDMHTDGLADMIRPVAQVVNAWFTQVVENRTLKNFNMNYYDSGLENFVPKTFEAEPWGWYPIPVPPNKRIQDVVMNVPVDDLSATLPELQWVIGLIEKAAATTTTQAGQVNERQVTLGEVEFALAEAKDRLKSVANYYLPAWEEKGLKFVKLLEAQKKNLNIFKTSADGYKGNTYNRDINVNEALTEKGYNCEVTFKSNVKDKAVETINVLNAVKTAMPNNVPLMELYERKLLDLVPDLNPEEIKQVIDFQKNTRGMMPQLQNQGGMGGQQPPAPPQITPGGQQPPMVRE